MSDTNIQDDQVDIPEGAPDNFAEQRAKKGLSPGIKLGILIGGVFSILGASLYFASPSQDPESVMTGAPSLNATPGGALQAENPLFQELLEQANDQRAQDALNRGETFIPIPEGQLEPVTRFDTADAGTAQSQPAEETPAEVAALPPPPPEPRVIEQRAIPAPGGAGSRPTVATNAPQAQQNPYVQGMIQQMGAISSTMTRVTSMAIESQPEEKPSGADVEPVPGEGDAGETVAATTPIIPAGTILYGETLTSSSSDLPGPVLVQVTNGPFKGGRLVGRFQIVDAVDRMVVEFTSMTLPDGTSVAVSAFAVDGVSAETAVASDVNRRYIRRYAPILAAAFITGYAGAASQPEQQVVELGDGNTVITGTSTSEQNLYAGLAAAGQAVGADLMRTAPKGPEVILRSGWPVGIMFVEPVTQ
jgi:intracellular multiplication protein IcmE